MSRKHILIGLWLLAALVSCQEPVSVCIMPADVRLRAGDVVFRRGCGLMSQAVLRADSHGVYSHTGIVVDSCGTPMIVHSVPAEPDYKGDPDRVKMESPEQFFGSDRAVAGEVRRPSDPAAAERVAQTALQVYRKGTLFDHDYDYRDTTQMYCTELVLYAFSCAGHPLKVPPSPTPFSLSIIKSDSIYMPSDILKAEDLKLVRRFGLNEK